MRHVRLRTLLRFTVTSPARLTSSRKIFNRSPNMPDIDLVESMDGQADYVSDPEDAPAVDQTFQDKRRDQNALFHSWCINEGGAKLRAAKEAKRNLGQEENEQVSIKSLLAKQETVIIKDPREYQLELFERAKTQNTIVVLDTGSGKTLVSVLLLRHVIDRELELRTVNKKPRVAFFLVPKVNLVFQQAAVLEQNLGFTVTPIHGAMNVDAWSEAYWAKILEETQVVVCTADILLNSLSRSFVRMSPISLMVFDEVHHAKLGHPYSKIMHEHYFDYAQADRPRLFSMTASPVDANVDIVEAARQLETTMDSLIATTSKTSPKRQVIHRPEEISSTYPVLTTIDASDLCLQLQHHMATMPGQVFDPLLRQAENIRRHLGAWCADFYWKMILPEKIVEKTGREIEKARLGSMAKATQAGKDKASLSSAFEVVKAHDQPMILAYPALSEKVLSLIGHLRTHFDHKAQSRCLIFVEERIVARLVAAVLQRADVPHLRPASLTGAGSNAIGDEKTSLRKQFLPLTKFRTGELNCLVATAVAEEGLDIPDCNLIIRFDPSKSIIQYVQSRGRARSKNSTMIHMLEEYNAGHLMTLAAHRNDETRMRGYCESLPADRYLHDAEDDRITELDADCEVFVVPKTGAKMTYTNSLLYLGHFVATLPNNDTNEQLNPVFAIMPDHGGRFKCEVTLPICSPLQRAIGKSCRRKNLARASAAFQAIRLLFEKEQLDGYLMPKYRKNVNVMRNALLAKGMEKRGNFEVRLKPRFWRYPGESDQPDKLYMTLIDMPQGLDRPHQPMFLISRRPLPTLPRFPLYLDSGKMTEVVTRSIIEPLGVSQSGIETLTRFTLLMFKDTFRKTYKHDQASMPYWVAPAAGTGNLHIDWLVMEAACQEGALRWAPDMDSSMVVGRLLLDPNSGGNRCFTTNLAAEYKPTDPIPPGTTPLSDKKKFNTDIVNSSTSLFGKARSATVWNPKQPVLEAQRISYRINLLAAPNRKELSKPTQCFVCPEPLVISRLPAEFVASSLVFPAIIHRIEEYLIVHEKCQDLGLDIDIALALEAFTKDSDHTDADKDQDLQSVRYVSGMGQNYERLEMLGDTLLKMMTTIATFVHNANDDEAESHTKRMLMLCNLNLANVAKELKLYEYIRTKAFSRRTWYPEGLELLEGKATHSIDNTPTHTLAEKSIADVSEALMGAAFATHHRSGDWSPVSLQNTVRAISKLVGAKEHTMQEWADYSRAYIKPQYQITKSTAAHVDLAERVRKLHPYKFRFPRLLRSALMHPSVPTCWEKIPSYQRLEFLGDSLLDAICVSYLFYSHPDKDPQWLTEHKMAMVSNRFLGFICVKLGLHRHLRHNHSELQGAMAAFEEELNNVQEAKPDSMDYWLTISEPPKCLADVVEAYLGAIFIDSDFDLNEVQRFFDLHMKAFFVDMSLYDAYANDHPMIKFHSMMEQVYGCKEFRLMVKAMPVGDGTEEIMAGVMIHKTVVGGSLGTSEKYTRVRAAQSAVEELQGLIPSKFRERFGCNCSPQKEST